jgi:hypothetical protein
MVHIRKLLVAGVAAWAATTAVPAIAQEHGQDPAAAAPAAAGAQQACPMMGRSMEPGAGNAMQQQHMAEMHQVMQQMHSDMQAMRAEMQQMRQEMRRRR